MGKVEIEKPAEFYEEVGGLITAHYNNNNNDRFAKKFPVVYGLYLKIAALGLRSEKNIHIRSLRIKWG